MLDLLQRWLADGRLAGTRLVVLTRNAVAAGGGTVEDLAGAAVWGMVRSAQTENPDRFVLLDLGDQPASAGPAAAALAGDETQLAIRDGVARAPRLVRVAGDAAGTATVLDEAGTVLIGGGTGGLGAIVARDLVTGHGARHLLLVSRRGAAAEGADGLAAELAALGADVRIAACDLADRQAVRALLDSIPAEHPLTAVVQTAGVVDDGTITSLTPDRLRAVLRSKVDAAWNLHELTQGLNLAAFVLFSSAAGTLGNPGQANYAAANTFLDALAQHRQARGLPGTSLAWGLWAQDTGMAGGLDEASLARLSRTGVRPLAVPHALALLDAVLTDGRATATPVHLDLAALREQAAAGLLPPVLRGLVAGRSQAGAGPSLAARLAPLTEAGQRELLLELVRTQVATVLAHSSAQSIAAERPFKELGFDSLAAIQFRNRLNAATGMRLPLTIVFDYPTAAAVAEHLRTELALDGSAEQAPALAELDRLEATLLSLPSDDGAYAQATTRLQALLWRLNDAASAVAGPAASDGGDDLDMATDDELFDVLENELGIS
jgi:NADP-dependent 3-hydroxy acid dehydrogenase YdfG/acyl carrier protein